MKAHPGEERKLAWRGACGIYVSEGPLEATWWDRVNLESSASALPITELLTRLSQSTDWGKAGRASGEAWRTGFPHAQTQFWSDEGLSASVDAGQRDMATRAVRCSLWTAVLRLLVYSGGHHPITRPMTEP